MAVILSWLMCNVRVTRLMYIIYIYNNNFSSIKNNVCVLDFPSQYSYKILKVTAAYIYTFYGNKASIHNINFSSIKIMSASVLNHQC